MPHLHIVEPEGSERDVELVADEYVIGRDPSVSLPLTGAAAAAKVSRRHARLFRRGKQWLVEDLQSSNGVYLDGARITETRLLLPESDLEISGFLFKLIDTPTLRVTLTGRAPPVDGQVFTLPIGEHDVGRADAPIEIPDKSVSRRHATVTVEANRVLIKDHQSSNGTFKNGARISFSEVVHGDVVKFGSVELVLSFNSDAYEPKTAPSLALSLPSRSVALGAAGVGLAVVLALLTYFGVAAWRQRGRGTAQESYEAAVLSDLVRAHAHVQSGRLDEAQRAFRDALDKDPLNREAQAGLATVQAQERSQAASKLTEQAAVETLSSRYAHEEVRQAVLRYAAGDVESAQKALRLLPESVAGKVLRDVEALAEQRTIALRAEQKKATADARRAWEKTLALDANIVPASYPSAVRDEAKKRQSELR